MKRLGVTILLLLLSDCSHSNQISSTDQAAVAHAVQSAQYLNLAVVDAAIKQNPNNALAHECLAEDLAGHDTNRCISEFRKAIRLQPNNRKAQFELAYELRRNNQSDAAKAIYIILAKTDDMWGQSAKRVLQRHYQTNR